MVAAAIELPIQQLAGFCREHHVSRLSLFGSALRGDFTPTSDVDFLVAFEPGHIPGLALIDMEDELSRILGGRRVDLVTEKFLNHRIRRSVLESARVLYER